MSLHLIESKKIQAVANRKRGGTAASVVLHVVLVAGVFTAASAEPVEKGKAPEQTAVYVAPPPPITKPLQGNSSAASSATSSHSSFVMPRIPDLANINIEIPTVSTDITIDMSVRDFSSSRGVGGGKGTATDGGVMTSGVDINSVLSDLQVERPVVALSGYRTPRYPEAMRAMGVEETLNATFIVDTLGRIEPGSLEVRDAQHQPFIQAVREALANARFRPAEVQGRRVRQRVMQPFVFSLSRI